MKKATLYFIIGALLLVLSWLSLTEAPPPPPPLVVDTLRLPPEVDFIEAFRLQCEWVPRQ